MAVIIARNRARRDGRAVTIWTYCNGTNYYCITIIIVISSPYDRRLHDTSMRRNPAPRLTQVCGWLCLLVAIGLPIGVVAFWLAANPV